MSELIEIWFRGDKLDPEYTGKENRKPKNHLTDLETILIRQFRQVLLTKAQVAFQELPRRTVLQWKKNKPTQSPEIDRDFVRRSLLATALNIAEDQIINQITQGQDPKLRDIEVVTIKDHAALIREQIGTTFQAFPTPTPGLPYPYVAAKKSGTLPPWYNYPNNSSPAENNSRI